MPPAGFNNIVPSLLLKHVTLLDDAVAASCVGWVTVAAAVEAHPASPVALLASVIEKV